VSFIAPLNYDSPTAKSDSKILGMSEIERLTVDPQRFEEALQAALDDLARAKDDLDKNESRVQRQTRVVRNLIAALPAPLQIKYYRQANLLAQGAAPRGTVIYGNVVRLLKCAGQDEVSAPKVREALEEIGVPAPAKAVHNVLNYLAREGRLKRIGRGRYLVAGGFGIELPEDIEGVNQTGDECSD
jgi:hypothetical protein